MSHFFERMQAGPISARSDKVRPKCYTCIGTNLKLQACFCTRRHFASLSCPSAHTLAEALQLTLELGAASKFNVNDVPWFKGSGIS